MADDDNNNSGDVNVTSSRDASAPLTSLRFVVPVAALIALNLVVVVGNSLVVAAVSTQTFVRHLVLFRRPKYSTDVKLSKNGSSGTGMYRQNSGMQQSRDRGRVHASQAAHRHQHVHAPTVHLT